MGRPGQGFHSDCVGHTQPLYTASVPHAPSVTVTKYSPRSPPPHCGKRAQLTCILMDTECPAFIHPVPLRNFAPPLVLVAQSGNNVHRQWLEDDAIATQQGGIPGGHQVVSVQNLIIEALYKSTFRAVGSASAHRKVWPPPPENPAQQTSALQCAIKAEFRRCLCTRHRSV